MRGYGFSTVVQRDPSQRADAEVPGLKSVRENACRPAGLAHFFHSPGASYAAGVLVVFAPPLAFNDSSHAVSKSPSRDGAIIAALKALRHPI
jgi:hypothetical protein